MSFTILIADQEPIAIFGAMHWLLQMFKSSIIHSVTDFNSLNRALDRNHIDLLLFDLGMNDSDNYETIKRIRRTKTKTKIIVFSRQPKEIYTVRFLKAGAHSYLSKSCGQREFLAAVLTVFSDRKYIYYPTESVPNNINGDLLKRLSNRELEIAKLLSQGYRITEIAEKLCVHISSVSTYRARVYKKLGVKRFTELVGLIDDALPGWQQTQRP